MLSVTALVALTEPLSRVTEKVTATPGMPLPRSDPDDERIAKGRTNHACLVVSADNT